MTTDPLAQVGGRPRSGSTTLVRVADLTHTVGGRRVLDGVTLEARPGEVLAISGASGAGKSTLLRIIGGLERPSSGTVVSGDTDVARLRGRRHRRYLRDVVGFVFQDAGLVEQWTVRQNIAAAARAVPRSPIATPCPVADAAVRVGVDRRLDVLAFALSGGERQRVAIARVLARMPPLVLVDEPTAALDPDNARHVVRLLRSLAADGAAVVAATHDASLMAAADAEYRLGGAAETVFPSSAGAAR